jgi:hypothetical protein
MQMIGQDTTASMSKGPFLSSVAKGRTKRAYLIDQNSRSAVRQRHREEERATFKAIASIPDHALNVPTDFALLIPTTFFDERRRRSPDFASLIRATVL